MCFTLPLIYPNLEHENPDASPKTSSEVLKEVDSKFKQECKTKALEMLYQFQQDQHIELMSQLESLPKDISENVTKLPLHNLMYTIMPVNALNKEAEELLWHQRLIHGGDHNYDTIKKHVDGIPNMSGLEFDDVTKCSTCLRTKLTKVSPGHTSLRDKLKVPYQGLYVDFGFSGKVQRDKDGKVIERTQKEVEGIDGETWWILISDGKTRMLHGDCGLTKASPIKHLRSFLCEYSPNRPDKWDVFDQGGELYRNPDVCKLFKEFGYNIFPTGGDASHQNRPVERAHQTIAQSVKAVLIGAGLDIKFWRYFGHMHSTMTLDYVMLYLVAVSHLPHFNKCTREKKTSRISEHLDSEYGFNHLDFNPVDLRIRHEREFSWVIFLIPSAILYIMMRICNK